MKGILVLCIGVVLCGTSAQPQNDSLDANVKGPKRPPTSVQVFGVNSTTVRITWNSAVISEGEEPIKGYKVRIWDESDDASLVKEIIVLDGEKLETIVDTLQSDYLYKMRVLAFSDSGDGRMTAPAIRFQTLAK